MAWTAPRTWSVGEVFTAALANTHIRDNFKYLKGQAGTVDFEDKIAVPGYTTKNSAEFGSFGLQSFAVNNCWLSDNLYYDGSNYKYRSTGYGVLSYFFGGGYYVRLAASASAGSSVSSFTDALVVLPSGNVGLGAATPQGKLHTYGSISGFLKWEYDGVDGTARTVIPDGAGDVVYALGLFSVVRASNGGTYSTLYYPAGAASLTPGSGDQTIYYDGGTNTCVIRVNANGSVDVRRTAGSLTYKVNLLLQWL